MAGSTFSHMYWDRHRKTDKDLQTNCRKAETGSLAVAASAALTIFLMPSLLGIQAAPVPQGHHGHKTLGYAWKLQKEQNSWFSSLHNVKEYPSPLQSFFGGIEQDQRDHWNPPRCGVPDFPVQPDGHHGRNRQKRFVLSGGRWEKTNLTYKIIRFPWQLSTVKVRRTLADALKVWSDVTLLSFTEVQEGRADIVIDFTRYWHGDHLPFDGPGGILAHAFFPKTHREGDVHFDYDETWTISNDLGTDLLQVAAHEFGHVLGLQHSSVSKSLMSPFYSFRYPLSLSEDDRKGIQHLYGKPSPTPALDQHQPDFETNEIPRMEPSTCDTDFEAVSMIRGELFFFKAQLVWRLRNGKLQAGYPTLASRHWQGIPEHIDAAFEDAAGKIWFFQGSKYWMYDGERKLAGPVNISELGLSVSHIQAAFMWGTEKTKKIYFFKGASYWRFSPSHGLVDSVYPRNLADWRGVPHDIDAAFQDEHGYAYFLKGRHYWKFDPLQVKVIGYPRQTSQDFFNCPVTPAAVNFFR
ncbi:stromelysin-3 isoform X1 [Microcaecilia unicolor]|uniref:Stromelysin-3 n=1 Tax=Microcaecilia unicolor TaxID=1415580 RepID=A0A6P7Z9V4_9AMPH|nr:stromelysin-3 isoform X1 [Microcaecilia unicolor]